METGDLPPTHRSRGKKNKQKNHRRLTQIKKKSTNIGVKVLSKNEKLDTMRIIIKAIAENY